MWGSFGVMGGLQVNGRLFLKGLPGAGSERESDALRASVA